MNHSASLTTGTKALKATAISITGITIIRLPAGSGVRR